MLVSVKGRAALHTRQDTGKVAEQFAAEYLSRSLGWRVIDRNWRCPKGELDLIAWDGSALVIVEVRSRSQDRFGTAAEAIDERKLRQLQRVIPCYLWHVHYPPNRALRVDAIALYIQQGIITSISHFHDVLQD